MWIWYCLRWICVYDVLILILYMHSYFLYVEFISYHTCGKRSHTPLWCRFASWWHMVTMSFPEDGLSQSSFTALIFGVLSNGALIRTVGILFMLSDYAWGTLGSFWWCTYFEIWYDIYFAQTYLCCDLIFYNEDLICVESWRVAP